MNKDVSSYLKKRIIQLANEKNMSINKACEEGNLTTSTLNTFLNSKCAYCNVSTLVKFCEGLNISLFEFFNDEQFKKITYEGVFLNDCEE